MPKKIDEKGNYTVFPGITVISKTTDAENPLWYALHELLINDQDVVAHFSPLPYQSYHMTAINVCTKHDMSDNEWENFVMNKQLFFQSLNQALNESKFMPTLSIQSIRMIGALQLNVTLPEEQVNTIKETAKTYGLEKQVPAYFHITLAYQFKHISPALIMKLQTALNHKISSIVASHAQQSLLNPPQLCFFKDMTHFTPWNGDHYPFVEEAINKNSFFAEKDTSIDPAADTKDFKL